MMGEPRMAVTKWLQLQGWFLCQDRQTLRGWDMDTIEIVERLDRIEAALSALLEQRTVKDWYSTEEAAKILGKAEFTIRNYCRLGRIRGEKKSSGRGKFQSWAISHDELLRVQREGILPLQA